VTGVLPYGLYDRLLDEDLRETLDRVPELRSVLGKLDFEEQPARYADFIGKVLEQALREEKDPDTRLALCNRLVDIISKGSEKGRFEKRNLKGAKKPLLLEITPPHYGRGAMPRPHTSMVESSLFTGSPNEAQLVHELQEEMRSADEVDILISFIKWSGLRLLMPAFEDLRTRGVPVRLLTTSYMGASDAPAVEWLAGLPNVRVKVSYDTDRTRLHAKAYHFKRLSGFSSAYIGSANMSRAAMTAGLEWNLKVTAQDMAHILDKFTAEFETYWHSRGFAPFDPGNPEPFRAAIQRARKADDRSHMPFFDLRPHPFQERILDALKRERAIHGRTRNLVIAATGTGKTVISAFDYRRFLAERKGQARLLFLAHRKEILEQAAGTFRNVLRDGNFGDLLVGNHEPARLEHLFCSIGMLSSRKLWKHVDRRFYDYIVIDEAHHGTADSYRHIFDRFSPEILLGLTATPERMDGKSVAADFGNRFAAEIRLPEALSEKLLCPFHYFGVADPVSLDQDRFWKSGKYDISALEKVYTGSHALARQRLQTILSTLLRYEPDMLRVKGSGFCVSISHAAFMAEMFNDHGIPSAALVSGTSNEHRVSLLEDFKRGKLIFLFTVDVFNEGLDVPELNTVLFLRPTESLTVFLQQLGRGLRHAPEKECLTVLDFVGQAHRLYRMDSKLKALLPKHRFGIDREVEMNFPHLPPGCAIQFDRLSREYVLKNIRQNLRNLAVQIPERLLTFENEARQPLTFGNFVRFHDYEPEKILIKDSWSGWKARARLGPAPTDKDLLQLKKGLIRASFMDGPKEVSTVRKVVGELRQGNVERAVAVSGAAAVPVHYRLWGDAGRGLGIDSIEKSFARLAKNPSILSDLNEILNWCAEETQADGRIPDLPFPCPLELHARYGLLNIQAALGKATLMSPGQRGIGVIHYPEIKAYALLVTFQKTEREFSPGTMYADYPISRALMHWESQSNTAQGSKAGMNLTQHIDRGYTILLFARDRKKNNGWAVPFTFLGPARIVSYESERPIRVVWQLKYAMPVQMFENNRRGG
jgi:superfamily II DNA or RNA helicase/HKD family nuclease